MKKIVEYAFLAGQTDKAVIDQVNAAIKDGWQPWGSLVQVLAKTSLIGEEAKILVQTMVKYAEDSQAVVN